MRKITKEAAEDASRMGHMLASLAAMGGYGEATLALGMLLTGAVCGAGAERTTEEKLTLPLRAIEGACKELGVEVPQFVLDCTEEVDAT